MNTEKSPPEKSKKGLNLQNREFCRFSKGPIDS